MGPKDAIWPGCWNARRILPGVWRASCLDEVDWSAVVEDGVRTVVDLRDHTLEVGPCRRVHAPLEAGLRDDPHFRELMDSTGLVSPLYYEAFCARWPERVAAAVAAVDRADRGVVVCCHAGWDRTGMIAAILLKRAGATEREILADYARSWDHADPDGQGDARRAKLGDAGTTWQAALTAFLRSAGSNF